MSGQVKLDNKVVEANHGGSSAGVKPGERDDEGKGASPPSLHCEIKSVQKVIESSGGTMEGSEVPEEEAPCSVEKTVSAAEPQLGCDEEVESLGSESPKEREDISPVFDSKQSACDEQSAQSSEKKSERNLTTPTEKEKQPPDESRTPSPRVCAPAPKESSQDDSSVPHPSEPQPSEASSLPPLDKPVLSTPGEGSLADDSISPTSNLVMDVSFLASTEPTPSTIKSPEELTEVDDRGRSGKLEQGEERMDCEDILPDGPAKDNVLAGAGKVLSDLPGVCEKGEEERKNVQGVGTEEVPDGGSTSPAAASEKVDTMSASDARETSGKSSSNSPSGAIPAESPEKAKDASAETVDVEPILKDSPMEHNQTETVENAKSLSTYTSQSFPTSSFSVMPPSIISSARESPVIKVVQSKLVAGAAEQLEKSASVMVDFEKQVAKPSLGALQKTSSEGLRYQAGIAASMSPASVVVNLVDGSKVAAVSSLVSPAVQFSQLSQLGVQVDSPQSVVISCMEVSSASMASPSHGTSLPAASGGDAAAAAELTAKSSSTSIPVLLSSGQVSVPVPIIHDLLPSSSGAVPAIVSLSSSSSSSSSSAASCSSPAPPTSSAAKLSFSTTSSESLDKSDGRLVKVGPGALAMPALTAVAPTVLTAAMPIIATPTTSARQTSTVSKKPVLSAGLSPTLSSNLAALFPSHAGKFAVPGNYAASATAGSVSDGSSPLVKAQQASRHPVVVTPAKVAAGKAVMVTPVLSASVKGDVLSVIKPPSSATGKTTPVLAKAPGVKGGLVAAAAAAQGGGAAIVIDPAAISSGAVAKLKAEHALALHGGGSAIQQVSLDKEVVSPEKLPVGGMQGLSFDFTNFVMPIVVDVLKVGSAVKFGSKKTGKGGDASSSVVPIVRMVNQAVSGLGENKSEVSRSTLNN